jgi:uncharacterized protein YecE (DUF72 family)
MESKVKIGACGFGRVKRPEYVRMLPVVEIQHTFYDPPPIETLEKWRSDVPDEFEFTLKAWQLITQESTSPTYKRLKRTLTQKEMDEAGFFKPTAVVQEALDHTFECARALRARTVLFQCPVRFQPLPENIINLKRFFSEMDRGGLNICWEPRGKWEDPLVKELCEELDLWHVVDPFARPTRYTYEDVELEELVSLVPHDRLSYVFFNNITMKDDAVRFRRVVESAYI